MIPIYEQGVGRGYGHGLFSFLERIEFIYQERAKLERPGTFAFIFHDFKNHDLHHILQREDVVPQLSPLSDKEPTIFYLRTANSHAVHEFNSKILKVLQLEGKGTPPCMLCLSATKTDLNDISLTHLNKADLQGGLLDPSNGFKHRADPAMISDPLGIRTPNCIQSALPSISIQTLRTALHGGFNYLLF